MSSNKISHIKLLKRYFIRKKIKNKETKFESEKEKD